MIIQLTSSIALNQRPCLCCKRIRLKRIIRRNPDGRCSTLPLFNHVPCNGIWPLVVRLGGVCMENVIPHDPILHRSQHCDERFCSILVRGIRIDDEYAHISWVDRSVAIRKHERSQCIGTPQIS